MSSATEGAPAVQMARIEISPEDWAEIRKLAIDRRTTLPKLLGEMLTERLATVNRQE